MLRAVSVARKANIGERKCGEFTKFIREEYYVSTPDGPAKGLSTKLLLVHSKRDNRRGKENFRQLFLDPESSAGFSV